MVQNQPYDESLEVSDGEEVASTTATPRGVVEPGQSKFMCDMASFLGGHLKSVCNGCGYKIDLREPLP